MLLYVEMWNSLFYVYLLLFMNDFLLKVIFEGIDVLVYVYKLFFEGLIMMILICEMCLMWKEMMVIL